jgi:hypothetical protein
MQGSDRDRESRSENGTRAQISIDAMAFAKTVAAEYEEFEAGQRDSLYAFFGRALTSYRKFLKDPDGYADLLKLTYIKKLREKPAVTTTSRLVLYMLTNAKTDTKGNTAGKYARVVDYLRKEGVENAVAAADVRKERGEDAILQTARGRAAPRDSKRGQILWEGFEEGLLRLVLASARGDRPE